jgi:hypothetical protein
MKGLRIDAINERQIVARSAVDDFVFIAGPSREVQDVIAAAADGAVDSTSAVDSVRARSPA